MLRSLQTAKGGMLVQQQKLELIANNLANANTTGFRRQLLAQSLVAQGRAAADGDLVATSYVDARDGAREMTGDPLHVAAPPGAYFAVQTADGEAFTRDGRLHRGPDGALVNSAGHVILGDGGPINVPPGEAIIGTDGVVRMGQEELGRLRAVRFDPQAGLAPIGNNLYRPRGGAQPQPVAEEEARFAPGQVERSNVRPLTEMIHMLQAQRIFESNQKVLGALDETLGRTVNDIPRTR